MIGVTTGAAVFLLVLAVTAFLLILLRRRRKRGSSIYSLLNMLPQRTQSPQETDGANPSQDTDTNPRYENLMNGDPIPGRSRGVVMYRRDYMNERPSRNLWYDRLQLIRPIAITWLRNAWGNVDQFGRHAYDVMQRRVRDIFVPYDKLTKLSPRDSTGSDMENSSETYDQLQRPPTAVVLPSRCGNVMTTEIA